MRVTLYSKPNFQETETRLISDWSPSSNGAYWDKQARSARVTRIDPSRPTRPSPAAGDASPTVYTQGGYQGRLIGIDKDFPGAASSSPYAVIRSLRVPPGWKVRAYTFAATAGRRAC